MIWTEMLLDCRTDMYVFPIGGITAAIHRSDILEHICRQHAGAIGDGFILMQDIARAHVAQVSMTFIDDTGISVTNWPVRSPELNPTEHAWVFDNGRITQIMYRNVSMLRIRNGRPLHFHKRASGVCHLVVGRV